MTEVSKIFADSPGKKVLMSGNEAFARGIFESGVRFAANYPGTPLSEVGDILKYLSETTEDFTFDYSLNEKVALESCIGASWAGVRTVAMFKHLGLNVAADPLHTFPYSGTNGGMLILCGSDPGILSSTNAQDNRLYSLHTKIPLIEPATVQECKDFIREGLKLSEEYNIPIYVHVTTRLCHSQGIVICGEIETSNKKGHFKKEPTRFINTLWKALANQKKYYEKISQVGKNKDLFNHFNLIKEIKSKNNIGILTSGICYSYVIQACNKLKIKPPILKLGLIFPINREKIREFAKKYKLNTLLIVEELEPFLESFTKEAFYYKRDENINLEIHGKDFLPRIGELDTEIVIKFLIEHFKLKNTNILEDIDKKERILEEIIPSLPIREPTFCPGCQYRPFYYQLKKSTEELSKKNNIEFILGGDISCSALAEFYPYEMIDWIVCMGAGIGIANGMSHILNQEKQRLIAFIGDSTLYHCGFQPLINAIKNNVEMTVVIFYNYWSAMTGHQITAGTPKDLKKKFGDKTSIDTKQIDLIQIVENLGIEKLSIVDAFDLNKLDRVLKNNLMESGLKVIILKNECTLIKKRRTKNDVSDTETYYTISDSCVKCNECIETLGCTAIDLNSEEKYYIEESRCVPNICPGICQKVCPNGFIKKTMIIKKTKL